MGNTSSTPQESEDDDTTFFATPGAVPTSAERPWGDDGTSLDDMARHATIAMSVIRRAGLPRAALIEHGIERQYNFDAALLARLRSELGYGAGVSDADISYHVWRLLQVSNYWSGHIRLETLKYHVKLSLTRLVGARTWLERLPMFFVVQSQLHNVQTCYLHGLEIVRFTRTPGCVTLCLHAGPATPLTPSVITDVCKLLLPAVVFMH